MEFSSISNATLLACFFSILGGLIRLLLKVDDSFPMWKQFLFIFIVAMPFGYLSYKLALDYGFVKAGYPLSFIVGIMALSIANKIAKNGANQIFNFINKKTK